MLDRTARPLAQRLNSDVTHYAILVIGKHTKRAYFSERTLEDSCSRATTIADIINGELGTIAKVFAFNPVEGIAQDVTEEMAIECANSLDPSEPVAQHLYDFIEHEAGSEYVRDLRVADRTFTAA